MIAIVFAREYFTQLKEEMMAQPKYKSGDMTNIYGSLQFIYLKIFTEEQRESYLMVL